LRFTDLLFTSLKAGSARLLDVDVELELFGGFTQLNDEVERSLKMRRKKPNTS
jgi:hypothetical protein